MKAFLSTLAIASLLLIFPSLSRAQERHGFFNVTEAGYGWGTGTIKYNGYSTVNKGGLGRLRTVIGHYVNPHLTLGAGIGLDGYTSPNYNTMPLFLEARGFLRPEGNTAFALLGAGYSLPTGAGFEKGVFANIGMGYKKGVFKWGSLLLSGGLNLHQVQDDETLLVGMGPGGVVEYEYAKSDILLYSLSLNVGLLIK